MSGTMSLFPQCVFFVGRVLKSTHLVCRRVALAGTFLSFLGCSSLTRDRLDDSPRIAHLFGYEKLYLISVLRECGLVGDVGWIRVNASGTVMFVQETKDGVDGNILVLNFVQERTEMLRPPARHVWLSADASFAAWSDNESRQVIFANGQTKTFVPDAYSFDVDSSGDYFVVMYTKGKGTEVFRTSTPTTPLFAFKDLEFWPSRILAMQDEIALFDDHYHSGYDLKRPSRCVVFRFRDNTYVEDRRLDIPGELINAYPSSGRIIVREKGDAPIQMRAKTVFDLRTSEKTVLNGSLAWYFLKEDYLNDRARIKRIAASSASRMRS